MKVSEIKALDQVEKNALEKVRIESDGIDSKFRVGEMPKLVLVEVVDPPNRDAEPVYVKHDRKIIEQDYIHEEVPEVVSSRWTRNDDKGYSGIYGKGDVELWSATKSTNYTDWNDEHSFSYECTGYTKGNLIASTTITVDTKADYCTAIEKAINDLINEHVNSKIGTSSHTYVVALNGIDLVGFEDTPDNTKDNYPSIASLNKAVNCCWYTTSSTQKGDKWEWSQYEIEHHDVTVTKSCDHWIKPVINACTHKKTIDCQHPYTATGYTHYKVGADGSIPSNAVNVTKTACGHWNNGGWRHYHNGVEINDTNCGWSWRYGCYQFSGWYTHSYDAAEYDTPYNYTAYKHTTEADKLANDDWVYEHTTEASRLTNDGYNGWVSTTDTTATGAKHDFTAVASGAYEGKTYAITSDTCNGTTHSTTYKDVPYAIEGAKDDKWYTTHGKLDTIQAVQPNRGCSVTLVRAAVQLSLSGVTDGFHTIKGIS